jgi:Zn-finger nucleic acid-binding protein
VKCPTCPDATLAISDRQGIEIDYCPSCRGVWLDRGELDKLIERAAAELAPPPVAAAPASRPRDDDRREPRYDDRRPRYDDDDHYRYKGKKKKSLLGEIFDF